MSDYKNASKAFERLLGIMDDLRLKCPWDKKQTLDSLRHLTIEEVYELSDSILESDLKGIEEELGDLILHIVFYAKIGSEKEAFDISTVIHKVCDKLVHRHPHIYGDVKAETDEEVKQNWEKLKLKEGKKSILQGVPKSLPSIVKAYRIQEKVTQVGFDWDNIGQVFDKVREELDELQAAYERKDHNEIEAEFGDLMFSLINYARFLQVEPERALELTNKKFISRFQYMEKKAKQESKELSNMTLEEMDVWWNEAKTQER